MTVETLTNYTEATGNGVATEFPFYFYITNADYMIVEQTIDGVTTTVSASLYTVNGVGEAGGGTVEFLTPPADGVNLVMRRQVPYLQSLEVLNQGGFYPESVEEQLDLMVQQTQQLADLVGRAAIVPRPPDGVTGRFPIVLSDGTFGFSQGTGADLGLREDLAEPAGGGMVGLANGNVAQAVRWVTPEMFGAVGDFDPDTGTGTDDTGAFNVMKAWLAANGGGEVQIASKYLIGDFEIDFENVILRGLNNSCGFGVKNGTLGILFSEDYSYATNLTYWSQSGDPEDGLDTRGEKYSKEVSNQSMGHMEPRNVIFRGFSGIPRECVNLVHAEFGPTLYILCKRGPVISKGGSGGADFSTTVNFANQYVLFCGDGGTITALQGAHYDVILQANDTPMVVNGGRFTCSAWLEANVAGAITCNDAFVNFTEVTNKPGSNAIVRNWSGLVTPAADRGYRDFVSFDVTAKHFNLLSLYGVDPKTLAGIGTTATIGLKFNEAVVAMTYSDDLLDQDAWASETTSEFVGWDVVNKGYKIATALTGVRGMRQSVSLDSTKTYIIQFLNKNVAGNAITTVQVDGVARTPGVAFTVGSTGSKVVRCFASQTITSENYVQVFRLMEVLEDQTQIPKTTDRLLRAPGQRSERYATTAPAAGYRAIAERTWNSNPASGQPAGWITTTAGSPGTALPFGLIGLTKVTSAYTPTNVTTDRAFDADTVAIAELADVVGTLINDLKAAGLLT